MRVVSRLILLTSCLLVAIAGSIPAVSAQGSSTEAYFEFSTPPHAGVFVFKLTDPARIQTARDILRTGNQKIVAGPIIKQPVYYNPQWSFHFDPEETGFADATVEVCDSSISGIENGLASAYPMWCPWATKLLREIAPPPKPGPGNLPPTISMAAPYANDVSFTSAPGSMRLSASADDPDGTIGKVEFFSGETKVGEVVAKPYTFLLSNLPAGTYTVSAVATDNLGATRSSASVRFTVTEFNFIDSTRHFVSQHYLDFFNRVADSEGLEFWVNNIDSCGSDAVCREVKRIDTSAAFFLSIEFQETGYLAHRFYKASFGRRPLFAEFLQDAGIIGHEVVVNSPGWQQRLENNILSFMNSWVTRPAFTSIYGGLNNPQYVDTLIANTGATFSPTDRNAFVDVLENSAMTRAQVLRLIVENEAFYNAEYNAAFVEMEYFGYLRRDPDEEGFNFWLEKLNEFGGDFRRADMVKSFLVSTEYRQRFGTP